MKKLYLKTEKYDVSNLKNEKDVSFTWFEPMQGKFDGDNFVSFSPTDTFINGLKEFSNDDFDNISEIKLFKENGGLFLVKKQYGWHGLRFSEDDNGKEVHVDTSHSVLFERRVSQQGQLTKKMYIDVETSAVIAWTILRGDRYGQS